MLIKLYIKIVAFATELITFSDKILLNSGDVSEDCKKRWKDCRIRFRQDKNCYK